MIRHRNNASSMNSVGKCTYMQNEENKNQKHKKYNEQTQTVYFLLWRSYFYSTMTIVFRVSKEKSSAVNPFLNVFFPLKCF